MCQESLAAFFFVFLLCCFFVFLVFYFPFFVHFPVLVLPFAGGSKRHCPDRGGAMSPIPFSLWPTVASYAAFKPQSELPGSGEVRETVQEAIQHTWHFHSLLAPMVNRDTCTSESERDHHLHRLLPLYVNKSNNSRYPTTSAGREHTVNKVA